MGDSGGLNSIRMLISKRRYAYGEKVNSCLENCCFTLEDIEACILRGRVSKIMKDRFRESVGNKVYCIIGQDTHGCNFYTQGKIMQSEDGKVYFLITAHN